MKARKGITFLLVLALLGASTGAPALAAPGNDDLQIKKGEENDNVILLQLRLQDLGFYNYKITGYFGDFTVDALKEFQQNNGLASDGVAGDKTLKLLYSNGAVRKEAQPITVKKSTVTNKNIKYGALVDWSIVNRLWKTGVRCKVVDFDTGITYYVKRCNQSYSVGHADVAPATRTDTEKMIKTFGGELNAYRRALIVYIGGQAIAASLYGVPHGSTGVPGNGLNLADGTLKQVCIHFLNSRNNIHHMVDPAHQFQIKRAAGKKPSGPAPALVYPDD